MSIKNKHRNSYPRSGTTWSDISGNRNNETLTNGPTFSSDNGGSIVLDRIDDDVRTTLFNNATGDITMMGWFYVNLGTVGTFLSNKNNLGGYCLGIG
jgi:hypothetical protein